MVPAMPPQRVEIVIGARTLLPLLGVGLLVALAILSLGTLLSIFLAAVLALGLDPVVGALVKRGWNRGRASLTVFAGLFVELFVLIAAAAAPVWNEIVDFVHSLPQLWQEMEQQDWFKKPGASVNAHDKSAQALKDIAGSIPDAASTLLGAAGGVFGSVLSLVTLTFLALFLLMERPPTTHWPRGVPPPR